MLIFVICSFLFSSWLNHISVGRHKPSIFTQSDILDKSKKYSESRTVKFGLQDGKFVLQDGKFGLHGTVKFGLHGTVKFGHQDGKTGHFTIINHSLLKNECDNKRKVLNFLFLFNTNIV